MTTASARFVCPTPQWPGRPPVATPPASSRRAGAGGTGTGAAAPDRPGGAPP